MNGREFREETPKEGKQHANACCIAIYIVQRTKTVQKNRYETFDAPLRVFQPISERWFNTAFSLAGYARFLEIQLPFHAAARLVGDSPLLQKTEDVFSLVLDEFGTKAETKGSHFRPRGFA